MFSSHFSESQSRVPSVIVPSLGLVAVLWILACPLLWSRLSLGSLSALQAVGAGAILLVSLLLERNARLRFGRDLKTAILGGEAHFLALFEHLPVGAMLIEADGALKRCNAKLLDALGTQLEALQAVHWLDPEIPILQADGNPFEPGKLPMRLARDTRTRVDGVMVGLERAVDGDWAWFSVTAEPRFDIEGQLVDVLCTFEDVTQRKTAEAELAIQTFRDRLTGLPNRTLFMERLAQAILRCERRKLSTAVLFLDLDRFKLVNDTMSHEAGDLLLAQVAKRIRSVLRPEDTVARLSGDEFVVLFEDLPQINDSLGVAERISRAFTDAYELRGQEIYITCSMGLALSSSPETAPAELVRDAEVAMYRAKAKGEGSIEIFDPSMNAQATARFQMEGELRHAVERNEFVLFYQPLVNLESGLIEGWEALVRWKHPERGMVPPLDFIPLAEETGLIVPIGKWVLEEACRQASVWQGAFPSEPQRVMNVNLSMRQFQQRDLIATVTDALAIPNMRPRYLKLEITESVMMRDPQASLEAMKVFRGLNIHLVVDDFGTGYSSLSYLKRFPVDTLKVDKSFVDGLGKDPENTAIVQAIVSLAKSLGMRVTAEGVETADQLAHLRALGCDQGQGYFFSRPLPAEAAGELLSRDPKW